MKRKELTKTLNVLESFFLFDVIINCIMTSNKKKPLVSIVYKKILQRFNPFSPEFTIVTFIHYKPRIAAAILDL